MTTERRYGRMLWQFIKFGLVGGSGVVVNMVVNIILNKLNGGSANAQNILWSIPGTDYNIRFTLVAWFVPFLVANVWNFQLNRRWTFNASTVAGWWREFWPFLAVGSVAALIGAVSKVLMTNPTSPLYLPEPFFHEETGLRSREYWSQLIAVILTMPVNFLINKVWTFGTVRSSKLTDADSPAEERPTA